MGHAAAEGDNEDPMASANYHYQLPAPRELPLAKEEFHEIVESEPKDKEVSEEYRKYYREQTPSSSEGEEEEGQDLDRSIRSTDTNLCSLPLMCVCTIDNIVRNSRTRPVPESKHRRQAGCIILKEVMTWVSRGEKPRRQLLRGRPASRRC